MIRMRSGAARSASASVLGRGAVTPLIRRIVIECRYRFPGGC